MPCVGITLSHTCQILYAYHTVTTADFTLEQKISLQSNIIVSVPEMPQNEVTIFTFGLSVGKQNKHI